MNENSPLNVTLSALAIFLGGFAVEVIKVNFWEGVVAAVLCIGVAAAWEYLP